MKAFCLASILIVVLGACSERKAEPETATAPQVTETKPAESTAQAPTDSAERAADETKSVWKGQVRIDAHAGTGTFNYVGEESGDFVPMRFRTDSEVGKKILAACGDEDLCEFEGTVRFLDEPPPENASAVGEIVSVDRVTKLPDAP